MSFRAVRVGGMAEKARTNLQVRNQLLEAAEEVLLLCKAAYSDNTESNLLKAAKYSPITGPERNINVSSKRNHSSQLRFFK
jgi:hypothetical protein